MFEPLFSEFDEKAVDVVVATYGGAATEFAESTTAQEKPHILIFGFVVDGIFFHMVRNELKFRISQDGGGFQVEQDV